MILFKPLTPFSTFFLEKWKRPLHNETKFFIPNLTRGIMFPVEKKEAVETDRSPISETDHLIAEQTFAFRDTNIGNLKNSIAICNNFDEKDIDCLN